MGSEETSREEPEAPVVSVAPSGGDGDGDAGEGDDGEAMDSELEDDDPEVERLDNSSETPIDHRAQDGCG